MADTIVRQIENGPRLLFSVVPRKATTPRLACHILVRSGSASDPEDKSGTAHVIEHLFARRTEVLHSLLTPGLRQAEKKGEFGHLVGRTELDYARYGIQVPAELWSESIQFLRRWYDSTRIEAADVERCKSEVMREHAKACAANPFMEAYDRLHQIQFGRHPYSRHPMGRPESVETLSVTDCKDFYNVHYHPANLTFTFVIEKSDTFALDDFVGTATRVLSALPVPASKNRKIRTLSQARIPRAGLWESMPRHPSGRAILLGLCSNESFQRRTSVATLLNQCFTGSQSELRRRLSHHDINLAGLFPPISRAGGYELLVQLPGHDDAKANSVLDLMISALESFRRSPPKGSALNQARGLAIASLKRKRLAPLIHLAESLALDNLFGRIERLGNDVKELKSVTAADVANVADELFRPNASFLIYR